MRTPRLLLLLVLTACLERPFDAPRPAAPRAPVDRAALQGVLIAALPEGVVPVGAIFANAVELVGYRLTPPALVPGRQARLTFYWRCRAQLEAWRVFVHLDVRDRGAGKSFWVDYSRPGEAPRYGPLLSRHAADPADLAEVLPRPRRVHRSSRRRL